MRLLGTVHWYDLPNCFVGLLIMIAQLQHTIATQAAKPSLHACEYRPDGS